MEMTIYPGKLRGSVDAPPSKSELHRALICAAFCPSQTAVRCPAPPEDIRMTAACLHAMGTDVSYRNDNYYVNQIRPKDGARLECGESGSTLRFLMPLAATLGLRTEFLCGGRLAERPMGPLLEILQNGGCTVQRTARGFRISGALRPGHFVPDVSESSQFLSGLLLALPLLPGADVTLRARPVSESYVRMTDAVLARFGVRIACENGRYTAAGSFRSPGAYVPEGDWTAAGNWLAAEALGADIRVSGLSPQSIQGDAAAPARIAAVRRGNAVVDLLDGPDLLPPLAVLAAVTPGKTHFVNAARLRQKESDRLSAVAGLLRSLGGECEEHPDGLTVTGVPSLQGGTADSRGDHRIVMAAAIAACVCSGPVTVLDAECVEKSYPAFWSDYERLGGKTT